MITGMSALTFLPATTAQSQQPVSTGQLRQADETGIYWPAENALPFFSTPVTPLKVIDINPTDEENRFSGDEINMFSCF